mmetsp:Transcript_83563/g.236875  ORF Transcript_83563/g.236875 Transcript_83563/m.236875 type:complete len:220 (+) Transcript_83563:839-1498(+)
MSDQTLPSSCEKRYLCLAVTIRSRTSCRMSSWRFASSVSFTFLCACASLARRARSALAIAKSALSFWPMSASTVSKISALLTTAIASSTGWMGLRSTSSTSHLSTVGWSRTARPLNSTLVRRTVVSASSEPLAFVLRVMLSLAVSWSHGGTESRNQTLSTRFERSLSGGARSPSTTAGTRFFARAGRSGGFQSPGAATTKGGVNALGSVMRIWTWRRSV